MELTSEGICGSKPRKPATKPSYKLLAGGDFDVWS
jgi:hypothetical protein